MSMFRRNIIARKEELKYTNGVLRGGTTESSTASELSS